MEKIIIPIKTDNNGKLKTVSALKQIQKHNKDIIFPNIDLEKISLSMLTLTNNKKCTQGIFIGTKYDNKLNVWNEGNLELIFE